MLAVILQARIDSSRLPGKSLLPMGGKPLILRVMEALNRVPADLRVLACPEDSAEAFRPLADEANFTLFTGPKDDVLERYCLAVRQFGIRQVIRATGDNPFVFTDAAAAITAEAHALGADYAGYSGLPYGAGVEAISAEALFRTKAEAVSPYDREHVCPYIYTHPAQFSLHRPLAPLRWQNPDIRLTVDTQEDYEHAQALYAALDRLGEKRYHGTEIIRVYKEQIAGNREQGSGIREVRGDTPATPPSFTPRSLLPILIVPAWEKGRGGGHLVRCMALVNGLRALGREIFLFLPAAADTDNLLDTMLFDKTLMVNETGLQGKNWEYIILDRYQTQPEEFAQWAQRAPVIGIDEGGPGRNSFDFLIDLLPNCNPISPNISDPSLLPLPKKKPIALPRPETAPFRILVTFGLEDSAGLGSTAAQALAAKNNGSAEITLLQSPIPNLSVHLADFDLIITHFGLTAFEALYAGVPVLLVSPGTYHEKLAKTAGFVSAGIGKKKAVKLVRLLFKKGNVNHRFINSLKKRCIALAVRHNLNQTQMQSLAELLHSYQPAVNRDCPVCGTPLSGSALARFPERTYRRCKRCGVINMSRLTPPPVEYGKEYFFEHYQKQYGKTYIEDFPNLTALAKRRLAVIQSKREKVKVRSEELGGRMINPYLLPSTSYLSKDPIPNLLDIGCAYGPFLAAARDTGFSPFGIDPSEDAVRYVTQTLGIPAVQGFFPPTPCSSPLTSYLLPFTFYAVTLWYVIEHFRDCRPALAEIHTLLEPDKGVLAFATPSFTGISGRSSLKRFLEHSPADHWTVWSPSSCKKALEAAGFKVIKIKSCGHHPQRFPFLGKLAQSKKSPLYWLLLAIIVMFSLGDTCEVYTVRQ